MARSTILLAALILASSAHAQLFPSWERNTVPADRPPPAATPAAPALPDPTMTPGAVATSDLNVICNGTTKTRRRVPTSRCDAVFRAYSIPDAPTARYSYECDHLIPLALGGSNAAANLWPQPNLEAARKDSLEVEMQALVCLGKLPLAQAQREIAEDWTEAERHYLSGR